MIARILPPAEWARLAGTELETVWPHLNPTRASIVVVEDRFGTIVGCWAAFQQVHVEGVWIHPKHRRTAGVAKRLLVGMRDLVLSWGAPTVMTAATTDEVRQLLARLGATQLPGDHYVLSV